MNKRTPAPELVAVLSVLEAGSALDIACGSGRHATWLAEHGWQVTAVDRDFTEIPGVVFIQADLEAGEFTIEQGAWDLIVCWLYWQPDLIPAIAAGIRPGGVVALAGKVTGRFAVSLSELRAGFAGWTELASGDNETRAFFIARRNFG